MNAEQVKAQLLSLPEISTWPEIVELFDRVVNDRLTNWEWPLLAFKAVSGSDLGGEAAVAAMACMQLSITIVDDILDDDPRGLYNKIGAGRASNIAFAFQAAAGRILADAPVDAHSRALAMTSLAQMGLATAFGQNLDVQNLTGEENYWRVVRAKSTPFYGAALEIGALMSKAQPEVAHNLYEFGVLVGEVIQIMDDLTDAFQTPAGPDWKQGRNNLPILYASTAAHPEREKFHALLMHVDEPEALREAQQILIRSGAVSYCGYHAVKRHHAARQLVKRTPLPDPAPLYDLLTRQIQPLTSLLEKVGAVMPAEIKDS